jgi:hypothetical protein
MLDAAKEFEASGKSRNYFAQQNMLREKTMAKIRKLKKGQTTIYKTLHIKLKIE